jgi:hypothetical protein
MANYSQLESENIDNSMFDYNPFSLEEIDDDFKFKIEESSLNKINEILKVVYSKLSGYRNVFVMTKVLEKYFPEHSVLMLNLKDNIVGKMNSRYKRTPLKLYMEILDEILTVDIIDMFLEQMKNQQYINDDNVDDVILATFSNNKELNQLYSDILYKKDF